MAASLLDRVEMDSLDVDDLEPEEFDLDPVPAPDSRKRPKGSIRAAVKPAARPASVATRKRIAAELQAYGELLAMGVIVRDETCGEVIHQQCKPAADAIADILADYPDLAAKFIATGVIGKWVKLAIAVKPIYAVVWAHHVTKSIGPADGGQDATDVANGYDTGRYAPFRAS